MRAGLWCSRFWSKCDALNFVRGAFQTCSKVKLVEDEHLVDSFNRFIQLQTYYSALIGPRESKTNRATQKGGT